MMLKIMWETLTGRIGHGGGERARRATALALALVLCFGVLPVDASAVKINSDQDDAPQTEDQADGADQTAAEQTGVSMNTGTQGLSANWLPLKNTTQQASAGKPMTNTYILETSSGTRQGGGTADNILYFSVQYTDENGIRRDAIIMPGEDAQQASLKTAYEQGNREARRAKIAELFGYTTENMLQKKAMGNVQTDQLMFTTPYPVQSIDKIQIFGRVTDGASNWSCQGMRIYRVDTLYGLEMYGWYSDWGYIDFAGEVVAQVMMSSGAGTFQWTTSGGVFNIVAPGEKGGAAGCALITATTKDAYESRYSAKTAIGYRHESQTGSAVTFRLDLADIGDAGLETLACSYEAGKEPSIGSFAYCECAALIVRYVDVFDCIREIALPVAINALGQLVDVVKDAAIAGYAQQGDTIAFTAMLPDFASLDSTFLTLGESGAVGAAHLVDIELAASRTASGSAQIAAGNAMSGPLLGQAYRIRPGVAPNSLQLVTSGNAVQTAYANTNTMQNCWKLLDAGGGYYYLVDSVNEGRALSAANVSLTAVSVVTRSASDGQKWKLSDAGDGYYYLSPKSNTSLYLAVKGGSVQTGAALQVQKADNKADTRFKFKFELIENEKYPITALQEGNYVFINQLWSKEDVSPFAPLLTIEGAGGQQAKAICDTTGRMMSSKDLDYKQGEVERNQAWHVTSAGDGYFYLQPLHNETYALDAEGPKLADHATAHLWEKTGGIPQQRWRFRSIGNGYYLISSEKYPNSALQGLTYGGKPQVVSARFADQTGIYFEAMSWRIIPASASLGGQPGVAPSGGSATIFDDTDESGASSALTEAQREVRRGRISASENDAIRYLSFSVYNNANVGVYVNGATVQYNFGNDTPTQYIAATSADGIAVPTKTRERLPIHNAVEGKRVVLRPADRTEQYLVTLTTDNVANSGTIDNLKISFRYINLSGEEIDSPAYDVRDFIKRYYGEWPGSVDDFAYKFGLRDGGTTKLIVPLLNVDKFTGVSFQVEGDDEWQFSGIDIVKIAEGGVSAREAAWREITAINGPVELRSHLVYSREIATKDAHFKIGTVYEEGAARPKPNEEGYQPGRLLQNDGRLHEFDGTATEVDTREEVEWSQVRNYMTLEDAKKGLGFTKQRAAYTVSVQVAKDKVNALDDDCGSKNLFYFRLLFEHGSSACTLANQQMVGDAFHTGSMAQFKIYANQDYGEVTAVQVIPDDQDGNGDIYDKLKIDSISVVLEGNKALSPTWEAKSDSEDGLGWVGIDFRDQGEMASNRGAAGRSLSQIATTYPITGKTYSAKLLVTITTAPYESSTTREDGVVEPVALPQLVGSLSVMYHYYDLNGDLQPVEGVDAVDLMNSYAGRASNNKRVYKVGKESVNQEVSYAVSNPAYQFRAGTTDQFFMTVKDISELVDMTFYVRSDVVTNWTISDVSVFLINGTGTRYLNKFGEYDYAYTKAEDKQKITNWNSAENISRELPMYDSNNGTGAQDIQIYFEPNTITISDEGKWSSAVTREPNTASDSLNLYIYPGTGEKASDPDSYDLDCVVHYTEKESGNPMQVSASPLSHGVDGNGRTVLYANGLDATNMLAFKSVEVRTAAIRALNAPMDYGILQRVRGGVLIETYRLGGVANADSDFPVSMGVDPDTARYGTQRLLLQFEPDMETQALEKEKTDLAVALYFKTNNPGAQELRSRYIYLTDAGIAEIKGGHVYELDYVLGDVTEIAGINVVAIGSIDAPIRAVYLGNQTKDGSVDQAWGVDHVIVPTENPQRVDFAGSVGLLNLSLKTAEDVGTASSGTKGPVRMTVGYYDEYGYLTTDDAVFDNIRPLIESGSGFVAGKTDTIRLLIPGCSEIRWVRLEPWHNEGTTNAEWRLDQIDAQIGLDGHPITRTIDKEKQVISEGTPLDVILAEVLVNGTVYLKEDPTAQTNEEGGNAAAEQKQDEGTPVHTGENLPVQLDSGEGLQIDVRVFGSSMDYQATLYSLDPVTGATGRGSLSPTHHYTDEQLAERIADAERVIAEGSVENANNSADVARALAEEVKAAKSVLAYAKALQNTKGSLLNGSGTVTFFAPRNYSGETKYYRLTIASAEVPSAAFLLDISVTSETELLTDAITRLETAHTNTLLAKEKEASNEAARLAKEAKEQAEAAQAAVNASN